MLLARVTRYCRFISLGTLHSMPLLAYSNHPAVMLDKSRDCEASTGWVCDFLADTRVRRLKGNVTIIKSCIWLIQFVTLLDTNILIVNIKV